MPLQEGNLINASALCPPCRLPRTADLHVCQTFSLSLINGKDEAQHNPGVRAGFVRRARAESLAIEAHLMRYKGQSIDEIADRINISWCNVFRHLAMPFYPEPEWGNTKPIGREIRDGKVGGEVGSDGGIGLCA